MTTHTKRLPEFDYLRGLAIAGIVLGHSITLSQPLFPALLENILRGGTSLFVFISGFFFHRIFYARFDYPQFIAKKASTLLIPFAIISLFALVIFMLDLWQEGWGRQKILLAVKDKLNNGHVLYPHWYIPFIFLTFLCSPLHLAYIRARLSIQILVLATFSLIALFLHRPLSNANVLQSLVYFTPYYLLGILFSQYEQPLRRWHWLLLGVSLALVAITALAQTYVWVHLGNYHKAAFTYAGIDLQFIQTLFASLALLALCRHIYWPWLQRHLSWLAELSFPIFFIHPMLTIVLEKLARFPQIKHLFLVSSLSSSLIIFILMFVVQFYGSVIIAVTIKRLIGARSRWLIG